MFCRICLLIVLFVQQFHAQDTTTLYYSDGRAYAYYIILNDSQKLYKSWHPSGVLHDSMLLTNGQPRGTRTIWFSNGKPRHVFNYVNGNQFFTLKTYRYDGSLKRTGSADNSKAFGLECKYNWKGELVNRGYYNKNKHVSVRHGYRSGKHLRHTKFRNAVEYRSIVLKKGRERRKIKRGALMVLKIDTMIVEHCLLIGFKQDSAIFSKFNYDRTNSRYTLKYDSTFITPVRNIDSFIYVKRNGDGRELFSLFLVAGGASLAANSFIMPILTGENFISDGYFAFTTVGLVSYLIGKKKYHDLMLKEYKLSEFKIKARHGRKL